MRANPLSPDVFIDNCENCAMNSVRIDKWLWAARFFKTRALAQKACDLGRIHSNGVQAKPAREVRVGDMLLIKNEGGEFNVEVLLPSEMPVRQPLHRHSIARPRQARLLDRSWPKSVKQCRSSRRCPSTGAC